MEDRLFLLKIKLVGIEPEIWRKVVIPSRIPLDRLHDIIQIVMGWNDYHLHHFEISNKLYTENPESKNEGKESGLYFLEDLIKAKGRTFEYLYDFGDNWYHEITIENNRYIPNIQEREKLFGFPPIQCLDGARACPPEDVGSSSGYYDFCEAISNPKHARHEEMKDWFANHVYEEKTYDPEIFNLDKINNELQKYLRWSRLRYNAFSCENIFS